MANEMSPEEKEIIVLLGARIAEKRKERGLSQLRLALAIDVSKSYLCDLEHGRRNVSVAIIIKICRKLGITMRELFTGLGPKKPRRRKRKRSHHPS